MPIIRRKCKPKITYSTDMTPRSSQSKRTKRIYKPSLLESSYEPNKSEHEKESTLPHRYRNQNKNLRLEDMCQKVFIIMKEEIWIL